ncbi:class I SAM-dependent methyltransferase [Nafulsella turpanensis]|uniref:class I SAM-dependent methyltransferase n=1 Tax=Nafulsella turpanensis TaxID=1265690 RepID=UPI00034B8C2B|nr:class I SAM-dependent methyltransferase [Nafulsella turpanensis]
MNYQQLNQELGNIDIYLLDAILKGRFTPGMRLLDAGCGEGRNLHWFIRNNYDAWACDSNPSAIRMLQYVARSLNPAFDKNRFITAPIEELPYPELMFDALVCSAVLHFAESKVHFLSMWKQLYRVLKPGGLLFIRMTSEIGMPPEELQEVGDGKYMLPDGSLRFLLTSDLLEEVLQEYPCGLLEPVKSVVVQNARSMATLVLQKKTITE